MCHFLGLEILHDIMHKFHSLRHEKSIFAFDFVNSNFNLYHPTLFYLEIDELHLNQKSQPQNKKRHAML